MEGVAALLSQGKTLEHVSIDTALDMAYLQTLVNSQEFQQVFKTLDPESYATWEEDRQDVESKRLVKSLARADAVENYKLARDIVRTGDLSDKDRLQGLFKMLDISGTAGDDVVEETVQLSQANLKNIKEALSETAKK